MKGGITKRLEPENASLRPSPELPKELPSRYPTVDITTTDAPQGSSQPREEISLRYPTRVVTTDAPRASYHPSEELPSGHPMMNTGAADGNMKGKGRKRAQMTRAQNADDSTQPSKACKSSSSKRPRRKNGNSMDPPVRVSTVVEQGAPTQQLPEFGAEERVTVGALRPEAASASGRGNGGYKSLRMSAINAVKCTKGKERKKCKGSSSSRKGKKRENSTPAAPVHHPSGAATEKKVPYKALRIRASNA